MTETVKFIGAGQTGEPKVRRLLDAGMSRLARANSALPAPGNTGPRVLPTKATAVAVMADALKAPGVTSRMP